jgi:Immunoglobulin I-set domain
VTWERIDQPKSERVRYTNEGHGTEIEIVGVDFDDAGTYRCTARNRGSAAQASQDISLSVDGQYFSLYVRVPPAAPILPHALWMAAPNDRNNSQSEASASTDHVVQYATACRA